jgi:exodeoxyribonuclease VII large subunit
MPLERIFSVSEFNEAVNFHLGLLGSIALEGEISQIKISQNKWLFMTLKDAYATTDIFGVTFQLPNLRQFTAGMKVKVYGEPRLHQKSGKFSLFAHHLVPAGEGALQMAFEQLKRQLETEGLFSIARKRPLPRFPQQVGLITAKNSEAYNDFVKVLSARTGGIIIYHYPVNVQGITATTSVINAFAYFNRHPHLDLIVITRGGGSLEDLAAFNDEQVARAVFSSKYPVVSGIGHERNETLVDLVADLRSSTPSNAAELISVNRTTLNQELDILVKNLSHSLDINLQSQKSQLQGYAHYLYQHFHTFVFLPNQLANTLLIHLNNTHRQITKAVQANQLDYLKLTLNLNKNLDTVKTNTDQLSRLLQNLSHMATLKRGFSIVTTASGQVIKTVKSLVPNQPLSIILHDGKIDSLITNITHQDNDQ